MGGWKTRGERLLFQQCRRWRVYINYEYQGAVLVLSFLQIPPSGSGQEECKNLSFGRNKKRCMTITWKSLCSCLHKLHGCSLDSASVTTYRLCIFINIPDALQCHESCLKKVRHCSKAVICPLIYTSYSTPNRQANTLKKDCGHKCKT